MDKEKHIEQREKELFGKVGIGYSRSKEEVWQSMEEMLDARRQEAGDGKTEGRTVRLNVNLIRYSIAASLALLIGLAAFARFHTTTNHVGAGSFATQLLPDGSVIHLNAETTVSFRPYWWRMERRVEMEGEAFFEVEKGKKFTVHSPQGQTMVLGTSFNIYARDEDYKVYCVTGRVQVTDKNGKQAVLTPGLFAGSDGRVEIQEETIAQPETILGWRMNRFVYNTTPLTKVFRDVERQYDVSIALEIDSIDRYNYTGLFERSISAEDALKIICFSFDLDLEKQADGTFRISQN